MRFFHGSLLVMFLLNYEKAPYRASVPEHRTDYRLRLRISQAGDITPKMVCGMFQKCIPW